MEGGVVMANDQRSAVEDDIRHDDLEYSPKHAPKPALAWLNLLKESETAFEPWNAHCDKIDRRYASLERLSTNARDPEFQMFWANCEVLKPSIYARPPVPVVVPKFKDRRPVYQAASEVLERCAVVAFDLTTINDQLLLVRDDVAMLGRGAPWCRYESGDDQDSYYSTEKVCVDFKHRRDFLHSLSRCWYEVTWVAGASYLTREEARERFSPDSGNCYADADYKVDKDAEAVGGSDKRERAKFWEIWDKTTRRVYWVSEGCQDILDEGEPHLDLSCYFPCPRPAYGTTQRSSLVPVPDVMQYEDQLEEINSLTGRIHALSDAIEVKGFYPSGTTEIADAIQAALAIKEPGRVLVPIANWAAFGGTKEVIIWLPIDIIAQVVTALVAIRKQVIDDIYQITGLSDIMRGETDARETLGAQELKTQFGSSRIRDRQLEMIRVARDLVTIACEIMCERFKDETLIMMSQTELPSMAQQQQKIQQLQQQVAQHVGQIKQFMASQQGQQLQQQPEQLQQMMQQAQAQMMPLQSEIDKLQKEPTIDQVLKFLRDHRARSFVLDIETDSTIMADENSEKERRTEFTGMLGQLLQQLAQLMAAEPKTAEFCGEVLKFSVAPFRAGRALDGAIDELVEQMKVKGEQPRGDDPQTAQNKIALQIEQMKQQRQGEKDKADIELKKQELQMKDQHEKMKLAAQQNIEQMKLGAKSQDDGTKAQAANQKMMHERETHQMDMVAQQADIQAQREKAAMAQQTSIARQGEMAARASAQRAQQQMRQPPRRYF
jgi:hypothetical protein